MYSGLIFLAVSLVYHRRWTQDLSMVGVSAEVLRKRQFGPIAYVLDGHDFAGRNLDGLVDNAKTPAYGQSQLFNSRSRKYRGKIGLTSKLFENLVLVGHYDLQGILEID